MILTGAVLIARRADFLLIRRFVRKKGEAVS
jgi:hypothetical protein